MGIDTEPKELLHQLKNVELLELEREDECCGFGGTFAVKEPHISAAMVKDKVDDISKTGASCLAQRRLRLPAKHLRSNETFRNFHKSPAYCRIHLGTYRKQ